MLITFIVIDIGLEIKSFRYSIACFRHFIYKKERKKQKRRARFFFFGKTPKPALISNIFFITHFRVCKGVESHHMGNHFNIFFHFNFFYQTLKSNMRLFALYLALSLFIELCQTGKFKRKATKGLTILP